MKIIKSIVFTFTLICCLVSVTQTPAKSKNEVKWTDVETALSMATKKDKPIFIDCYTSWCGWCKVLDEKTFSNDTIARILNYYYYPVKFDAESNKDIKVNDKTYRAKKNSKGNYTTHELMSLLWEGQKAGGYPSMIIRKGDFSPVNVEMGYRTATDLEPLLIYFAEGYNKKLSFDKFSKQYIEEYRNEVLKKIF